MSQRLQLTCRAHQLAPTRAHFAQHVRRSFASTSSAVPGRTRVGAEPTLEDVAFAHRIAAAGSAITAADATDAAGYAAQILQLPVPETEQGAGGDPWAVPLAQLLRGVVSYRSWLVPTGGSAMQTMSLGSPSDRPFLVACVDASTLANSPSPLDPAQREHVTFKGSELVYQWNQSLSSDVTFKDGNAGDSSSDSPTNGLGGIVINPSITPDGQTSGTGVLNELCLPHLISISMAQPAEEALATLDCWLDEGDPDEEVDVPVEVANGLRLLARYPFTALVHMGPGGEQRLQTSADGNAVLLTAVDLAAAAAAVLNKQDVGTPGEWRAVHVPLSGVVQAAKAQDSDQGIELTYGWCDDGGVQRFVLPSVETTVDLWAAADVDLVDLNSSFWTDNNK